MVRTYDLMTLLACRSSIRAHNVSLRSSIPSLARSRTVYLDLTTFSEFSQGKLEDHTASSPRLPPSYRYVKVVRVTFVRSSKLVLIPFWPARGSGTFVLNRPEQTWRFGVQGSSCAFLSSSQQVSLSPQAVLGVPTTFYSLFFVVIRTPYKDV